MNIGIDIDDTINELHDILMKKGEEFNKREKIDYQIQTDKWEWIDAFGWDEKTANKFIDENMENLYLNAKIKQNAEVVINKLHTEGNKIIIITARGLKNADEISEKWLKEHNIKFDKLITNAKDKAKKCIENNIDVFIDDHARFLEGLLGTKTKALLFDSPYNKQETKHKRVYTWDEVYEEIKNK